MQSVKEFFEQKDGIGEPIEVEYRGTVGKVRKKKLNSIRRNIDYSPAQYKQIQKVADELGITSQALVKMAVQQFLNQFVLAQSKTADKK